LRWRWKRPADGCPWSGSRHAARLRGAISGKNKSDVIDADVLARAGEVFELTPPLDVVDGLAVC